MLSTIQTANRSSRTLADAGAESVRPTVHPVVPAPFGWRMTALAYGAAGMQLWVATRLLLPAVQTATGWEPLVVWFVAGGFGFFLPLLLVGLAMVLTERLPDGVSLWRDRLWFRRMNGADWMWGLAGLGAVYALCGISMLALRLVWGNVPLEPTFLTTQPLSTGRWWILAAWIPFFLVNILGEELLWHGVLLPRQVTALGSHAALASGLGWLVMHAAFGLTLLILWPVTLIIPYVVQHRRNAWLGVLIHAGLNGPGFLAIAFGLF